MTHFTVLRKEKPTDAKKHLEEIQFSFFKQVLVRSQLIFDAILLTLMLKLNLFQPNMKWS